MAPPVCGSPINVGGQFVASRGPLYIPPSEQGQPVIFHAGGSPNSHELAGRYANGVFGAVFTLEDAAPGVLRFEMRPSAPGGIPTR